MVKQHDHLYVLSTYVINQIALYHFKESVLSTEDSNQAYR